MDRHIKWVADLKILRQKQKRYAQWNQEIDI